MQGLAGRGSLHNRHCQSKRIWPAATASASYGQLCAGCMISAHAEPGTAQVAGGIKAAARCGRGRCPSRRWREHAHWPWSCRHVFKARVLCCNASSKWTVSGRDRQAQRSDHGSDCSCLALQCKQRMGSLGQRPGSTEVVKLVRLWPHHFLSAVVIFLNQKGHWPVPQRTFRMARD